MTDHIKKELEHTVKEDARKHAALEEPDVKEESVGCPVLCSDLGTDLIVVIQDELTDEGRDVIPIKCELDKIVTDRPIRIAKVEPSHDDLFLVSFRVQKSFIRKRVLKAAWSFGFKTFLEIKSFSVMYFSSLFAITAKKIFPIVFVRAIGLNSDGSCSLLDFASNWIVAADQFAGMSFVCQTLLNSFTRIGRREGHLLNGT